MKNLYDKIIIPSYKNRIEIEKISKNLSNCFDLSYFYFYKVKNDGSYAYFSNRMDWNKILADNYINNNTDGILSWYKPCNRVPGFGIKILNDDVFNQISSKYEINYLLEFGYANQEGFEYFGIGTSSPNQNSLQKYINQIPFLKLFVKQMRKKHSSIFNDVEANFFNISPFYEGKFNHPDSPNPYNGDKKVLLNILGLNINDPLSKREEEVATLVIKGLSANEIAEHFDLSKRTVECHINSLKQKLNCYSKSELVEMCQELDSINFFQKRPLSLVNQII